MKNKLIAKKQSLIKTLLDGASFSVPLFIVLILIAGLILAIYADKTNNETLKWIILHIYFLIPVFVVIFSIIVFAIVSILDFIKAANRIRYLPLTKTEFDSLTENMTLTECLNWLDKTICFGGIDGFDHVFPAFSESRYSGYILQYYLFAYEKYKDSKPLKNEKIPNILFYNEHCIFPVNCAEVGIIDDLGFKNYYQIRSKLKKFYENNNTEEA